MVFLRCLAPSAVGINIHQHRQQQSNLAVFCYNNSRIDRMASVWLCDLSQFQEDLLTYFQHGIPRSSVKAEVDTEQNRKVVQAYRDLESSVHEKVFKTVLSL